jgi:hypothetical protein
MIHATTTTDFICTSHVVNILDIPTHKQYQYDHTYSARPLAGAFALPSTISHLQACRSLSVRTGSERWWVKDSGRESRGYDRHTSCGKKNGSQDTSRRSWCRPGRAIVMIAEARGARNVSFLSGLCVCVCVCRKEEESSSSSSKSYTHNDDDDVTAVCVMMITVIYRWVE